MSALRGGRAAANWGACRRRSGQAGWAPRPRGLAPGPGAWAQTECYIHVHPDPGPDSRPGPRKRAGPGALTSTRTRTCSRVLTPHRSGRKSASRTWTRPRPRSWLLTRPGLQPQPRMRPKPRTPNLSSPRPRTPASVPDWLRPGPDSCAAGARGRRRPGLVPVLLRLAPRPRPRPPQRPGPDSPISVHPACGQGGSASAVLAAAQPFCRDSMQRERVVALGFLFLPFIPAEKRVRCSEKQTQTPLDGERKLQTLCRRFSAHHFPPL